MNPGFIAKPPLKLGQGSSRNLLTEIWRILRSFLKILCQVFIPFNPQPEPPQDPPKRTAALDSMQVDQCQRIYDQVEATRIHLEQKARATFALVAFLAPLLASIFLFVLSQTTPDTTTRTIAIVFSFVSAGFLLLGFVSIVRAVSVQVCEEPFLGTVIDLEKEQFRKYDNVFHASGLLYCASVNAAMNAHRAQFVKGAHILTAAAVIVLIVASVPTGIAFSDQSSSPVKAEIVGSVKFSSTELAALRDDVAKLSKDIAKLAGIRDDAAKLSEDIAKLANSKTVEDWLKRLEARVATLETNLRQQREATSVQPGEKGASATQGAR